MKTEQEQTEQGQMLVEMTSKFSKSMNSITNAINSNTTSLLEIKNIISLQQSQLDTLEKRLTKIEQQAKRNLVYR